MKRDINYNRYWFKSSQRSWISIILIFLSIIIIVAGRFPGFIEKYYATGFYPLWSRFWRILLGWIPVSLGDLLYLFVGIFLLTRFFQFVKLLFWKRDKQRIFERMKSFGFILLCVFVFFYISWGLNYSRKGIAHQLDLDVKPYSLQELDTLTGLLQNRLNYLAGKVSLIERKELNKKSNLFELGESGYQEAFSKYPFLKYSSTSLKPSIFSYAGNYLGFSGYYNPFTSEAQLNTTVPVFTRPFITYHEIAHQVGYARENEANFVAYLVGKNHSSISGSYSIYFEMYRYAVYEIHKRDTSLAATYRDKLHPQVRNDLMELMRFSEKYESVAEDYFMGIFNLFLKANKQPAGTASYNLVVAWLEAYRKKYGNEKI